MPDAPIEIAQLYLDRDMPVVEAMSLAGGVAAVYSSRSPDKSTPNEDSAAVIPFGGSQAALVVADGVGGGRQGELASATAVRAIGEAVAEARLAGGALRDAILTGIERANRRVLQLPGAATTVIVVEIGEGTVRSYHVGDSMVVVVSQRGLVRHQTVAHSPVAAAVAAGMIDADDAMHHADRHVVSNVVGSPGMRIEVGPPVQFRSRDTVLAASDGLFDNLLVREIVQRVRKGPLERSMQQLAEAARLRMTDPQLDPDAPSKPDDLTFVGFRPVAEATNDRKGRKRIPPSVGRMRRAGAAALR